MTTNLLVGIHNQSIAFIFILKQRMTAQNGAVPLGGSVSSNVFLLGNKIYDHMEECLNVHFILSFNKYLSSNYYVSKLFLVLITLWWGKNQKQIKFLPL